MFSPNHTAKKCYFVEIVMDVYSLGWVLSYELGGDVQLLLLAHIMLCICFTDCSLFMLINKRFSINKQGVVLHEQSYPS